MWEKSVKKSSKIEQGKSAKYWRIRHSVASPWSGNMLLLKTKLMLGHAFERTRPSYHVSRGCSTEARGQILLRWGLIVHTDEEDSSACYVDNGDFISCHQAASQGWSSNIKLPLVATCFRSSCPESDATDWLTRRPLLHAGWSTESSHMVIHAN
jgi:hypothetical protein